MESENHISNEWKNVMDEVSAYYFFKYHRPSNNTHYFSRKKTKHFTLNLLFTQAFIHYSLTPTFAKNTHTLTYMHAYSMA